ncbi:MAG: hypothetical protein Q8R35_02520, partial [bacterium]|nr:hypothetical protein [bacterium]
LQEIPQGLLEGGLVFDEEDLCHICLKFRAKRINFCYKYEHPAPILLPSTALNAPPVLPRHNAREARARIAQTAMGEALRDVLPRKIGAG